MSDPEICPKCSAAFDARKALLSGGVQVGASMFSRRGPYALKVKCPNCWHTYPPQNHRLFGVLPPDALPWIVGGLLALCLVLLFFLPRAG